MNTEKTIVVLLLIAILLSVVTLAITMSANVQIVVENNIDSNDMGTASVILDVVRNPAKGGFS